ncbi:MAG: bifunctional nuclease family protein [Spirochaetota bacterium]
MAAETFVEADIWTVAQTDRGNVVLVRPKGSEVAVPIFIGQLETHAILIGIGKVEVPRPLTHDLAKTLIETLGASIARVEISSLHEGTFFAQLILYHGGHELRIDCRPSDALGIAVRGSCPIFIAESVIDEAGIAVSLVTEGASIVDSDMGRGAAEAGEEPTDRGRIQAELEKAIELEDYERAALLRDRLRDLGG